MTSAVSMFRKARSRPLVDHPIRDCDCGCGHSFVADMGNRARKYAPDCPRAEARDRLERDKQNARQRLKSAARRAERREMRKKGGRMPSGDGTERRGVKVCNACGNLPERRPREGCGECRRPAGPPAPIVPFAVSTSGYDGWIF